MANPNIWTPGAAINADSTLKTEYFTATAGQTLFTLENFAYVTGTGSVYVYVSGLFQRPGLDFTETSPTSITLTSPVSAGTVVSVVAAVEVTGTVSESITLRSTVVATAGQQDVAFPNLTYAVATNNLQVFVNGSKQIINLNYTESSVSSIRFVSGLNLGDVVEGVAIQSASLIDVQAIIATTTGNATVAADGDTEVNSPVGQFLPGQNNIRVYRNGVYQSVGEDYTENPTGLSITFLTSLDEGDKISFIKNEASSTLEAPASAVSYIPAGTGAVATNVQEKLREFVSVKDFGGDIEAAINSLSATGGTVFFPKGTYEIPAAIPVTVSNLTLEGETGTTIEITGATIHNAFTFTAASNIVVRGLRFEWNGAALYQDGVDYPKNYALRFKANASTYAPCYDVLIEDCHFEECLNALFERLDAGHETAASDTAKRYHNVVIRNNTHSTTLTCDVAYIDGNLIDSYQVVGNTFSSDADGASCIRMVGGSVAGGNQYSDNGIVSGNSLSTHRYAIYIGTATHVTVSGNVLDMNGGTHEGIDFENCSNCTAEGNRIYATGKPFALFYKYSDITISDNQIELNSDAAYFVQHSASATPTGNLTIINNTVKHSATATVYAQLQANGYGGHLVISGNTFDNVVVACTGTFYTQTVRNNYFEFRMSGTVKLSMGDLSGYAPTALTVADNVFLGVNTSTFLTGVVINSIVDEANTTVLIERNQFTRLAVPLIHVNSTTAATTRHIFRDCILDTIDYAFGPTGGGVGASGNLYIENLTTAAGVDFFGSPAGFTSDVGGYGCAYGSRIRNSIPASGPTAEWINISTTGTPDWRPVEITKCAFSVLASSTASNVTGNGTDATVTFDTEVYDDGGNFASNTFTAPVTGRYRFSAAVNAGGISGATLITVSLVTSNRTYYFHYEEGSGLTFPYKTFGGTVLADMDAGDTAVVKYQVGGMGADNADIYGNPSPFTYFTGELVQ